MRIPKLAAALGLCCFTFHRPLPAAEVPRVIPRPQIEDYGRQTAELGTPAEFKVAFKSAGLADAAACKQGLQLLTRRLRLLGAGGVVIEPEADKATCVISRLLNEDLANTLRSLGAKPGAGGKRLEQAYALVCGADAQNHGSVRITACSDVGIYYGLVSLCQLLDKTPQGGLRLPGVKLLDWPEIGLRLAKTSASRLSLAQLREFAAWMPLYKINLIGLQFHGPNSKEPGPFTENVKTICSRERRRGILQTVVYFCPFRGDGYDFNAAADQRRYAEFLQWMLAQGAHGIEVDYNDWPGRKTPIEDVINLACRAVAEKNPQAYMLYCAPSRGTSVYRGPASAEMRRILSLVPTNVWPLWVGSSTTNALIERPLEPAAVEAWTRAAGRRPFLWINRVSARDGHLRRPFSRPVSEVPGAFAFRGEFLPKDLDRLFEGVHFNSDTPSRSDPETLAYLATAADYVWNPRGWEAVESCRRARRFAEIMAPLLED